MSSLKRFKASWAFALILIAGGCATTGHDSSASEFPVGKYGNGETVAVFNADGTFSGTTTKGEEWVRGTYTYDGNEFTMMDTWEGPMLMKDGAGCVGKAGRYAWSLTGDVLVTTAIDDPCNARKQGTSGVAWTRM